jgi:hypothetical protein
MPGLWPPCSPAKQARARSLLILGLGPIRLIKGQWRWSQNGPRPQVPGPRDQPIQGLIQADRRFSEFSSVARL